LFFNFLGIFVFLRGHTQIHGDALYTARKEGDCLVGFCADQRPAAHPGRPSLGGPSREQKFPKIPKNFRKFFEFLFPEILGKVANMEIQVD